MLKTKICLETDLRSCKIRDILYEILREIQKVLLLEKALV